MFPNTKMSTKPLIRHFINNYSLNDVYLPMLELVIDHPVGKSLPADPDALQDSVAGQLMHHQVGIQNSGLLVVVGHDTSGGDSAFHFFALVIIGVEKKMVEPKEEGAT